MTVGILAYGSLLDDPGPELAPLIVRRAVDVRTPFPVEFARSSRSRDGAPTLVPVTAGGAPVAATILELAPDVDEERARRLLFRRESRRADGRDRAPDWILTLHDIASVETCLYTALEPNIDDVTAGRLAELAVRSAARQAGRQRRDGISYLAMQLRRGVETPLSRDYAAAVLVRTGAASLEDAWRLVREQPARFDAPAARVPQSPAA